jgi:hypothetical protein
VLSIAAPAGSCADRLIPVWACDCGARVCLRFSISPSVLTISEKFPGGFGHVSAGSAPIGITVVKGAIRSNPFSFFRPCVDEAVKTDQMHTRSKSEYLRVHFPMWTLTSGAESGTFASFKSGSAAF